MTGVIAASFHFPYRSRNGKTPQLETAQVGSSFGDRFPLADILQALYTLLNFIVKTKGLTDKQRKKLLPDLNRLELAHYHGHRRHTR
jgi:hypothetical protein